MPGLGRDRRGPAHVQPSEAPRLATFSAEVGLASFAPPRAAAPGHAPLGLLQPGVARDAATASAVITERASMESRAPRRYTFVPSEPPQEALTTTDCSCLPAPSRHSTESDAAAPPWRGSLDRTTGAMHAQLRAESIMRVPSEPSPTAFQSPPHFPSRKVAGDPWRPYEAAPCENMTLRSVPPCFYRARWWLFNRNPLTRRAFGTSTIGEVLVFLVIFFQALFALIAWSADVGGLRYDVGRTGTTAGVLLMLVYFSAMHANVPLLLVLGLPFDRVIPWHRLLALSATLQAFLHGLAWYSGGRVVTVAGTHHIVRNTSYALSMEVSGWAMFGAMVLMIATALSFFKRRHFATFFRIHVLLALAVTLGSVLHGYGSVIASGTMPAALPGLLIWGVDILLRVSHVNGMTIGATARASVVWPQEERNSAPVVELRIPSKRRVFTAGQWVFLCIPRLGLLHWHPFTISSGSHDKELTLHISASGVWTQRLLDLAVDSSKIKVYLEGPYGAPCIDFHGTRFKSFLIITAGLGWSFGRSFKRTLLADARRGRPVHSIRSVQVLRQTACDQLPVCSGWAEGEEGEEWPEGLDAQEVVYLTGEGTRLETPCCAIDVNGPAREPVSSDGDSSGPTQPMLRQQQIELSDEQRQALAQPALLSSEASDDPPSSSSSLLPRQRPIDRRPMLPPIRLGKGLQVGQSFFELSGDPYNACAHSLSPVDEPWTAPAAAPSPPSYERPAHQLLGQHASAEFSCRASGTAAVEKTRAAAVHAAQYVNASTAAQRATPVDSAFQEPSAAGHHATAATSTGASDEWAQPKLRSKQPGAPERAGAVQMREGRPNFASIFDDAAAAAHAAGDTKVAVLVCANAGVQRSVLREAAKSRSGVSFACHAEAFSF